MFPTVTRPCYAALALLAFSINGLAAQATISLDDDAPGDPAPGDPTVSDPLEDGSLAHPFDALDEAVDAAQAGDILLLEDGIYRGSGNRGVGLSATITIRSRNGSSNCIIDCEGTSNAFGMVGSGSYTLNGLRIVNGSNFSGGAIRLLGGGNTYLVDCVFDGNQATSGDAGAIRVENSYIEIRNCIFTNNTASGRGGALSIRLGSRPIIVGCTFANNTASEGGGIYAADSSESALTNSVLWGNVPEQIALLFGAQLFTVNHNNVQGGLAAVTVAPGANLAWGVGNLDADPHFVDAAGGDVHLLATSPCIGAGDGSAVLDATDFEGDPRIHGSSVDMGADESHPHLYVTGDETPGGTIELKLIGPPGAAPVALAASLSVLDAPIPTVFGPLFLGPLLPGSPILIGPVPADGSIRLSGTLPAGLPPLRFGVQALILPRFTNLEVVEVR